MWWGLLDFEFVLTHDCLSGTCGVTTQVLLFSSKIFLNSVLRPELRDFSAMPPISENVFPNPEGTAAIISVAPAVPHPTTAYTGYTIMNILCEVSKLTL